MSERNDLFDTILAKLRNPLGDYASAAAAFATDAVLAAGYRKTRVLTAPEELEELPEGVIIESRECPAVKVHGVWRWTDGETWAPELPVTVLYTPEVTA